MIIVISCGDKKAPVPTIAGRLYTGSYHVAMRTWAESMPVDIKQLYILSALYGLVPYEKTIAPYDKRLHQPGAITAPELRIQAISMGLHTEMEVIILGGQDYVKLARAVWPYAVAPLKGGMGKQIGQLTRNQGCWPKDWR